MTRKPKIATRGSRSKKPLEKSPRQFRDRVLSEQKLEAGYRAMADDEQHEREALEWIEGLIGDVQDDPAE